MSKQARKTGKDGFTFQAFMRSCRWLWEDTQLLPLKHRPVKRNKRRETPYTKQMFRYKTTQQ